jgi:alkylation response protein AidB-like acyl-CoA dehydrogenase
MPIDHHDIASFRAALTAWLDQHASELAPTYAGFGSLDERFEQYRKVKRALWDADWGRYGWPEQFGGLGGAPSLRAVVGEEIAMRDLADASCWTMIEVLTPTVITFAPVGLAEQFVTPFLRGDEMWSQGFSEPGTGSDLSSLTCRATTVEGGWSVTGQKVWTSFVQYSQRCVLLTRTGEPGSAHRGITALFVDVDSPGISYSPIEIQNGRHEFAEVFFDDVFVPTERLLGEVNGGWAVAMDILPYERSTTFWHRGAFLHYRTGELAAMLAARDDHDPAHLKLLGEAFQGVLAFRARSLATQRRIAAGEQLGAETSIDKILIAGAEQQLFEAARDLLDGALEFGTDDAADAWRMDYLYSKAATIYGGTAEIQRNIVARRLLDLGAES